jgi:nucleotide-binding universal stress UspA family protein
MLGARVAIVRTSRADKALSRMASCALALLLARHKGARQVGPSPLDAPVHLHGLAAAPSGEQPPVSSAGHRSNTMYRSILVPLDRSAFAEQALPLAVSIARRAHARLDLVQVHELYALADPACEWAPFDPAADAAWKEKERLYLDATAGWVNTVSSVEVTAAVLPGAVADALVEHSEVGKADLIMMATHGRGAAGRVFFGGVADEVLRRAPAPLLLVRPGDRPAMLIPAPVVEHLLIPLDGSRLAEQALGPALELGRLMEARCTLLRVVDSSAGAAASAGPSGGGRADAEAYLEGIATGLRREGLTVQTRVVAARPAAEAILKAACDGKHDLVALATHGRGGVRRMLLGSVASQVVRGASTPIFVYRPPA